MRQAARRGLLTVMATGSVLASTAGYAYADAGAAGTASDSPGVGSGNTVQVPVDVPTNVCGNTIDVVGLLNPAMGNDCRNSGSRRDADAGAGIAGGSHGSPGVGAGNTVQIPVDIPLNACGDSVNAVGAGNPAFGNHCANHGGTPQQPTAGGDTGGDNGGGSGTPSENCSCTPPPPPPTDNCPPPVNNHPQPPPPQSTPPQSTPPVIAPQHRQSPPPPQQVVGAHQVLPTRAVLASTGAGDTAGVLLPTGTALLLGGAGLVFFRRSRRHSER
ncbi:LPXTG-motif cell wall-anchored protein [Streptacidiphilus sp. EB129]